jgi:hypothetical protein
MLRPTKLVLIGMLFVLMSAGNAAAKDWWGWLEEFSGPGPFEGPLFGSSLGLNFCVRDPSSVQLSVESLEIGAHHDDAVSPCVWVDARVLHARESQGFPSTNAFLVDSGLALSFRGLASAGAGLGMIRMISDAAGGNAYVTRLTILPRITVSPLLLLGEAQRFLFKRDSPPPRWLGVVKAYYKPTFVAGSLSAADFGVPDLDWPGGGNEWQQSWGISFDFLEFKN